MMSRDSNAPHVARAAEDAPRYAGLHVIAVNGETPAHTAPRDSSPTPLDALIAQAKHEWVTVVDLLPQVVCLLDERGQVLRTNRAVENWLLGSVTVAKEKTLHELLHPRCRDECCYLRHLWSGIWEDFSRGGPVVREAEDAVLARRLSFRFRIVEAAESAEAPVSCVVAVIEDVTERRSSEALLRNGSAHLEQQLTERTRDLVETDGRLRREIEDRRHAEHMLKQYADELQQYANDLQDLYNNAPCGYHSLDENGTIIRMNDTELAWLGYTCEEVVGKPLTDFMAPASRKTFAETFSRFKKQGFINDVELELIRKDGATLPVLLNATAFRDASGRFIKSRSTVVNIAARKEVERALRKSEESHRRIVETMLEGLVVYSPDGRIDYVNDTLCRMLDYPREELVGRQAEQVFGGLYHCTADRSCHPRGECPCARREEQWTRGNGETITVVVSMQRIDGPDGAFLGCFAVVMDMTGRKRAEEALQRSERELRLLSAELLVAHESERKRIASELHDSVGQILGALKYRIEAAVSSLPPGAEQFQDLLPRTQSAIDEVRRISMDLHPPMLEHLGLLPTITWFCREFQGVYRNPRFELALAAREEDVPPTLRTVIYRLLQEALNNVVKHARANSVQIALECRDAELELVVRDDGAGFEPARVVPQAGDPRGLGLTTMRERAENSGGRFRLDSAPGCGTHVRVTWPCPAPAPA